MLYYKKVLKIKYCLIVGKLVNRRRFDLIHDETPADVTEESMM